MDDVCLDVYAVALRCPAPVSRPPLTAARVEPLDATPVRHVPRGAQVLAVMNLAAPRPVEGPILGCLAHCEEDCVHRSYGFRPSELR